MRLDGKRFQLSSAAAGGVVNRDTRLEFVQRGTRVLGRYHGGTIRRGYLVGQVHGRVLRFRYAQAEVAGHVHAGSSTCRLELTTEGRLRLYEHFRWETRNGYGTNVFDQVGE